MSVYTAEMQDLLCLCLEAQSSDLPAMELYLKNIGANATLSPSATPLLAVIIRNFAKYSVRHTAMLPSYIEIFLRHGFDSRLYGAACLYALCESVTDEKLLSAGKLLLDSGASISAPALQNLLRQVSFLVAYHDCHRRDHYLANLYFSYRQMLLNHFNCTSLKYSGITHYTYSFEQTVSAVMLDKSELFPKHIYLFLSNSILIIQNYPNLYLCSSIESAASSHPPFLLAPHPELTELLNGKPLHNISFYDSISSDRPNVRLSFSDLTMDIKPNSHASSLEIYLSSKKYL